MTKSRIFTAVMYEEDKPVGSINTTFEVVSIVEA